MIHINYPEALKTAAQSMVRVKNPVTLIRMITRFLDKKMGVRHASIIVHDPEKDYYVFWDSKGEEKLPINLIRLDINHPIIRWFSKKNERQQLVKQDFLSIDKINLLLHNESLINHDKHLKKRLSLMKQHMQTFKATICVPGYYKGELLGIFLLGGKKDRSDFTSDEIAFLQTLASDASMTIKNAEYQRRLIVKIKELEHSVSEINRLRERDKDKYLQTIITLAQMVDARDPYTFGHSEEINKLGMLTAKELCLDLTGNKEQILSSALLLHDVGKLGVPDEVLHKKGPLTEEEWYKMRDHVRTGTRILENHDDFKEVCAIIMHHHENYDGTGYPYKLKGEEIPIQSRIISVVDAFHAIVSDRPYRKGLSYDYAIQELKKCSGTQFDPKVVKAFLKVIQKEIKLKM